METFEIYKFLHVSLAIIWVGGGIFGAIVTERAKSAAPAHTLGIARDLEFVAKRVFAPAAMFTLVFGILMVLDADAFEFEQAWIAIGIGAVAISAILGMTYLGPQSTKLVAELEAGDANASTRLKAISRVSLIDVVILLVAVWAMVVKPGLG